MIKKTTLKKYSKADLIYDANHTFYKYHDIKKSNNLSFESKYSFIANLFDDLNKLSRLKPQ